MVLIDLWGWQVRQRNRSGIIGGGRGDPLGDGKVEARNRLSTQRRAGFPTRFLEEKADRNVRSPLGGFFHDDADRWFSSPPCTLSEACVMTGWQVHTWVLMANTLTFSSKLLSPTELPE
jgi:hypothetical protein